jgi:hypothetical protein
MLLGEKLIHQKNLPGDDPGGSAIHPHSIESAQKESIELKKQHALLANHPFENGKRAD